MSKRPDIRIALEKFLKTGEGKGGGSIVRDQRRRPLLIPESQVDFDRIAKSGRPFLEMGRRLRIFKGGAKPSEELWVLPTELGQISRDDPASVAGLRLPFGTIVQSDGLWLRYDPGYTQIGTNDRGDLLFRFDPAAPQDPSVGPVPHAVNRPLPPAPTRVLARLTAEEFAADRKEAEAWLKALALLGEVKSHKTEFKCAGIDGSHSGNDPYLTHASKLGLYEVRDTEMIRLQSLLQLRFRKARRQVPKLSIATVNGIPKDAAAWSALQKRFKAAKKEPAKLGLPEKLADSRFYDPAARGLGPGAICSVLCLPLAKGAAETQVLLINPQTHVEVRGAGALGPLSALLAQIDVLTTRSSVAVLSKSGGAVCFTGVSGSGASTAALFWADKDGVVRRRELRRRYEADLRRTPDAGRLGEAGIQKELDRLVASVGILCQDEGAEILKEGAGRWVFWPAFRSVYVKMAALPARRHILSEHDALLENALGDFGGTGDPDTVGEVTHTGPAERVFYEPDWKHIQYDRAPRVIAAHVFVERGREAAPLVRKVGPRDAIEWLMQGRTPDGTGHEPMCQPQAEFCALLRQIGVTGEALGPAYEGAQRGRFEALGDGDARLGEAIFDRLDAQVKLWLDTCREIPTFIANGSYGREITQDAHWLLAEHPELFGGWQSVGVAEFQRVMLERYGVTYGPSGDWTHLPALPSTR